MVDSGNLNYMHLMEYLPAFVPYHNLHLKAIFVCLPLAATLHQQNPLLQISFYE